MNLASTRVRGGTWWLAAAVTLSLGACNGGNEDGSDDEMASSTGEDGGTTFSMTGEDTVGNDESTGGESGVLDEDTGDDGIGGECLLWGDDCNEGQKCMPWSLAADRIPDELRCCPAMDNPKLEGEECNVQEYDGSCEDDCAPGTMCVVDNLDTLSGVCRSFCNPSGNDCDPDDTCKPFFELVDSAPEVPLCMDQCDPLLTDDCIQPGWLCLPDSPTVAGQSGFICTPPAPGSLNAALEGCALANDCQPGLVCILASRLPECSFTSCCSPICSLAEGDAPCQDADPDLDCIDWMSPDPQWQDVGVCALPE